MSPIDGLLLAALLGAGVWRLAWPERWRGVRTPVCVALIALAVLQIARLGFTWQFLGGYLLLGALALPWRASSRPGRAAAGLGLGLLLLTALGPWVVLPAPSLPAPRGPYAVGSAIYRWVDASRAETMTADPTDRRNVIAQAWYPAARPTAGGRKIAYMDGLGQLPAQVVELPRFIFRRFGQADTHAIDRAPVSAARSRWPVVVFSPGYGAPRFAYAGLLADLASRGYAVVALDHPYESPVVQLADGRVVGPAPLHFSPGASRVPHMERQVVVRSADVRFVLDQLARAEAVGPLAGRLDLERAAVIGHSFGGATAVLTASHDPRVRAAADIDGMLYGDVRGAAFRGPLLLVQSAKTDDIGPYAVATRAAIADVPAGGWRYAIGESNHLSFTDAERFMSPPARWVAARVMHGARGAADTQAVTVDLLDAFLHGPLRGEPGDIAAVAARARDVRGGREP